MNYRDIVLPGEFIFMESYPKTPSMAAMFSHSIANSDDTVRESVKANFILSGCITCKTLGDDTLHNTGFAFKVQALGIRGSSYDKSLPIPVQKGTVDMQGLANFPIPSGNFAD